jgi:hypothetical protein
MKGYKKKKFFQKASPVIGINGGGDKNAGCHMVLMQMPVNSIKKQ